MKSNFFIFLLFLLTALSSLFFHAECAKGQTQTASGSALSLSSPSVVLIESNTGKVLFEKSKDEERIPASITKIMTLCLIFDEIEKGTLSYDDMVTVSETASKMGGSQVYLEPNEEQSVNTMIKCISIASANDAAVAMAEKIAGSESAFVERMNKKAKSLGMKHTHFINCSGLDDDITSGHYSSAYDVALMSRELLTNHPEISKYSTVWMDEITHKTKKGESKFGLTNTNKLVRYYKGITGLKTGSTSKAKYCLSASATRNGISLIAVIMGAPDHKVRFSEAASLLDYGFANCHLYECNYESISFNEVTVTGGTPGKIQQYPAKKFHYVFTEPYDEGKLSYKISDKSLTAPIKKGDTIGNITFFYENNELGSVPLLAMDHCKKASYLDRLVEAFLQFV